MSLSSFADRDLFMRYHYGMSVGHTYMHKDAFPPPTIPQIPADFNHYIPPEPEVPQPPAPEPVPEPEGPIAPTSGMPLSPATVDQSTTPACEGMVPSSEGEGLAEDRYDDEPDVEGGEGERSSYWDDFADRELIQYDDMYGDDT